MSDQADERELRVLLLSPTQRDAALTQSILGRAQISCVSYEDISELALELSNGAGAVLLTEESVSAGSEPLQTWLQDQSPWSDLPVLILARPGADSEAVAQAMDSFGNVTVLERPMRVSALVSAVRTALRARQRQYQIREHLVQRERIELELREDDRRKDEFLAVLAHELRNPLAPIRHALELIQIERTDDPGLESLRKLIERQVDHLVRLVDDLLEISRITRGKIELRKETVDIGSVMLVAIETSRPQIERHSHRLELHVPAESLTVEGDPVRLAQVFANLLNNAAKYTDPGGVIRFEADSIGPDVRISVQDNGIGIPPEMLGKVFEIFRQSDHNMERSQGGLGIGLTLVKSLVESHRGRVEAFSAGDGCGSRFVVTLPRSAARMAAPSTEATKPPYAFAQRFLVVDDNKDAATSLGALLEHQGAVVQVAFGGEEALSLLPGYRPTVILLDLGMPRLNGHEVAKQIRQTAEFSDVTLIALTGWGQPQDRLHSKASGFDHHLVKPISLADLELALSS